MRTKASIAVIGILLIFCQGVLFACPAYAAEKRLNISTVAERPLYVDRLVFTALNELGIGADFSAAVSGYQSCRQANEYESDGVISFYKNMSETYPNLRRVPIPIESSGVFALSRLGDGLEISGYDDLSGKKIGILSENIYIRDEIPENASVSYRETFESLLTGLLRYDYDAVVLLLGEHEDFELPAELKKSPKIGEFFEYLYLNQRSWALIPEITGAMSEIFESGRSEGILSNTSRNTANTRKTIIHIVSSSSEITRERQLNAELRQGLGEDSLEFYYVELNLKRFSGDYNRLSYYAGLLRQDSISRDVAAVIVSGAEAYDFLSEYYDVFFKNTPVIFYGVNKEHVEKNTITDNIMGIYETLPAFDTVSWALSFFKSIENLYVVNDYTRGGREHHKEMTEQLEPVASQINIAYNENLEFNSLLDHMQNLPPKSLIVIGSYFQDGSGKFFSQNEVKQALEKITKTPIVSFYSTDLPYGTIGGRNLDYQKNGEIIASMLKEFLSGELAGETDGEQTEEHEEVIHTRQFYNSDDFSRWVFDKNQLDEWKISEKRLPDNSQVLNTEPGIWETNPEYAYSMSVVIILCIVVIVGLFGFLKQYRRQNAALLAARKDLHTKEELLAKDAVIRKANERITKLISSAPISYMMCVGGTVAEINDNMKMDMGINIGDSVKSIFAEQGELDIIVALLATEGFIKNRVVKLKFADGSVRRYLMNVATSEYEGETAIVLWGADIEKGERKKDEIHAERQNLQTILDTMPMPVSIIDAETLDIVYGNNLFLKLMEVSSISQIPNWKTPEAAAELITEVMSLVEIAELAVNTKLPLTTEVKLNKNGKIYDLRLVICFIEYNGKESIIGTMTDLKVEKENVKMRLNLQTILDTLPIPVVIMSNDSFGILYANNCCASFFEYDSNESVYDISVDELYTEKQKDGTPFGELVRRVNETNTSAAHEIDYVSVSGRTINAQVITCPIDYMGNSATLGIIRDMTQELEHRKIRESLQTVLDALPIPVRILELETAVTLYVNNSFLEMLGFESDDEILGRHVLERVAPVQKDGREAKEKLTQIINAEETFSMEIEYLTADGKSIDTLLISSHIDFKGIPSSLGIIKDLTVEKERQRMLLNAAAREREANELKSRFLVNMSHEIRTPMNAIIGLSEIELRKKHQKSIIDTFKKINVSAEGLLQIINEILDFSKIEANKIQLLEDEFNLEEVISKSVIVSSPRLEGKPVELLVEIDANLPRFLIGDDIRLWQILKNFLDNAAKFTDSGEIVLTVKAENGMSDEETGVCFEIRDTGIGMSPSQLNTVFMPYEQFYSESQKKYTGTGLGMPIAKQLTELMGGSIKASSVQGEGTKIVTKISFKRPQKNKNLLLITKNNGLSGKNILIIDDNPISVRAALSILEYNGVSCLAVKDADEALDILNGEGALPDVVLINHTAYGKGAIKLLDGSAKALSQARKILMIPANYRNMREDNIDDHSLLDGIIEKPLIPSAFVEELTDILGISDSESDFEAEDSNSVEFENVTVLVCEDNPVNQEVAAGLLEYLGIVSVIAENGRQAVEMLDSGKRFDLIFMDLQMPIMDGFETASHIRSESKYDSVPIISLSADAMPEISKRCADAGMNDNLAKPIDFNELHAILLKWLPKEKRIT